MARRTGAAVLHAVRRVAAVDATDGELLARFVGGDETSFADLVKRHGAMVLGVCRRVLPTVQDAEDACQATFLVLARKAASGHWQASIANWLYTTARRIASRANRAASRRTRRESRSVPLVTASTLDQMTGREAFSALDEELDRLPAIYREPLVLCYLEGLTRDEAAARLRVPPATLKSQLDRGRKRLGDALTRRGVAIGAGFLACAITSPAGASPSRVFEAIQAMMAGKVPPNVAALARGVTVNGFVIKSLLGAVVFATAAAIGIGFGLPTTSTAGAPADKEMPAKSAKETAKADLEKESAEEKTRTVTGKVIDADGKPVAGAEIVHLPIDGKPIVAGKSAADGTFKVTVPMKSPGSYLFPRVAGFASKDYLMPALNTPAEKTFSLIKDTPIRGRVIDTQGKPVAGASIIVRHLAGYGDTLDGFLTAWQKRQADGNGPDSKWHRSFRSWNNTRPAEADDMFAAVTDKEGRFTIAHLGSERVANLHLSGPGIADGEVVVLLRAGFDPTPYNRETLEKLKTPYAELGYHPMFYPPDTAIVAEAEKPIRGIVKETDTGKPRAGVTVTLREPRNHRAPTLTATTDANGRYEIHGAKKTNEYELSVQRDAQAGILGRRVTMRDTPAYEPISADIGVARGIVLTGRLLDDQTGEPVSGFICVGVLSDNESAKIRPEFDSPDSYDNADAKADGIYRTVVPPGPILIMAGVTATGGKGSLESRYQQLKIDRDYPHYFDEQMSGFRSPGGATTVMQGQWCKVLKLKPDETEVTVDIRFKRASRFTVKIQDSDGKPLTGVLVAGNTARDWNLPQPCEDDSCIVLELDTVKPRFLAFVEPKRKLVGTLTLKGDEKEPAVAKLGPAGRVKGKLVGSAGQPVANAFVVVNYEHRAADEINDSIHGGWRSSVLKTETNAAGEFEIDMVIPGEKFAVYARKKDRFLEPPDRKARFTVKAGESADLGAIKVKHDGGE